MKRASKAEFLRIVRMNDGAVCIDINQKADGRGAYVCKNEKCFEKAEKRKWLSRSLKCDIAPEFYEELRKYVNPGE